ncbi:ABC transporter ATP-binding protein [Halolamina salifodinae]|uniref:Cu-processing system ATP-binding protein n=1 Tax=Halolamina salifodinae TaxID=1202767 RepID=A0A8T4GUD1_9EURY|nr:ABC transporter ATP-binding protein [Halolamina salifodinae]MBP1986647.1 Cu-processing system ATP-binding protein [Halolamina salifodinae]
MNAIQTTDLTKRYGDVVALDGVSLSVEAGTTFGLLGTNGAGKSTLFRMLVGHLTPDSGNVTVGGRDVTDAGHELREAVGYVPEDAGFPPALTGREVLDYQARIRGVPRAERADRVAAALGTVGLDDAADRRVGGYSNGMNRRLALASALLARPTLLLLDEPTAGLDPLGVAEFHRILERLREEADLTVVITTHVLAEVEALCDDVAVLHQGNLRFSGAVDDLREMGESGDLEPAFRSLIADAEGREPRATPEVQR